MDENTKSVISSKTFWASLATTFIPMFPAVGDFISSNPGIVSAVGVLFGALRFFTTGSVSIGITKKV